jgi:hypothetical protein
MKKKVIKRKETIKDFIGIYDGYIDEFLCKKVLELFNKEQKFNRVFKRQQYHPVTKNMVDDKSAIIDRESLQHFNDHDLDFLLVNFKQALDHYLQETNILEYHKPFNELSYTSIKIQKTSPGQGYHVWHVERKQNNYTVNRMLAFTIYLNEVKAGETEFLYHKQRVEPKVGRIAIWPATFPYIHRGNPPLDKDKFIVTSWMLLT